MSRFMGGFATAAVMLGAAAVAGRVWLAAGFAVAAVVLFAYAMARYLRRRPGAPLASRETPAESGVFGVRTGDRRPHRNRR
jgi:membrane protein implicated in regulation of membrane protease activity